MIDSGLKEYIPGKSISQVAAQYGISPENIIKLGSNENTLGPSHKVKEILLQNLNNGFQFEYYPDAMSESLVETIKKQFPQIGKAAIVAGNGMDHILECLGRLFLEPSQQQDKTLIHVPTFDYYEIITRWAKAEPIFFQTHLKDNFQLNVQAFLEQITEKVKMIFLCSPNNPTGNILSWPEIEQILQKAQKVGAKVFLDEAYSEFSQTTYIDQVQNYDNLIVGKTFSKVYGLASLRIGWAVLPQIFLDDYRKVQTPFNVNSLALIAAKAALEDQEHIEKTIQLNLKEKNFLKSELKKLGFEVLDSQANFLSFLAPDKDAKNFCLKLLTKGIIVRNASLFRGAPEGLVRLTVGTEKQNQKVIEVISSFNE